MEFHLSCSTSKNARQSATNSKSASPANRHPSVPKCLCFSKIDNVVLDRALLVSHLLHTLHVFGCLKRTPLVATKCPESVNSDQIPASASKITKCWRLESENGCKANTTWLPINTAPLRRQVQIHLRTFEWQRVMQVHQVSLQWTGLKPPFLTWLNRSLQLRMVEAIWTHGFRKTAFINLPCKKTLWDTNVSKQVGKQARKQVYIICMHASISKHLRMHACVCVCVKIILHGCDSSVHFAFECSCK